MSREFWMSKDNIEAPRLYREVTPESEAMAECFRELIEEAKALKELALEAMIEANKCTHTKVHYTDLDFTETESLLAKASKILGETE